MFDVREGKRLGFTCIYCLIVGLVYSFVTIWSPVYAESFQSKVVGVSDGDTIVVMHRGLVERIRLHGIDAPEKAQDFGNRARQFLRKLVFGKDVTVMSHGTDKYGRTLGTISLVPGGNVNHEVVRNGYAWWYRKYAPDDTELARLEAQARREQRGLWAKANPIPPWEFRHGARSPRTTRLIPLPSGDLPILGNRRSRIYHLPTCDSYGMISPRNRVRFADERAAQQAGYRLEPISKISPAADDDMPAATSSNLAKKSSVYLKGYASGFFPLVFLVSPSISSSSLRSYF